MRVRKGGKRKRVPNLPLTSFMFVKTLKIYFYSLLPLIWDITWPLMSISWFYPFSGERGLFWRGLKMGSRGSFVNNSGNLYCKKRIFLLYCLITFFWGTTWPYVRTYCPYLFLGLLRVKKRGQEKEGPKSALKSFKFFLDL